MELNKFWTRLFGVIGILGGITLLTGDMLFYYDPLNSNFLFYFLSFNLSFKIFTLEKAEDIKKLIINQ